MVIFDLAYDKQTEPAGIIFCLVAGSFFLAKRAGCPCPPGPCQFPTRALDMAAKYVLTSARRTKLMLSN